jgi:hypothetical protein
MSKSPCLKSLVVLAGLAVVLAARPALAGPPLLCHPFEIGGAASLPWSAGSGWQNADAAYPLTRLVSDTQSLLTPSTPVVVRMETLRRAAIYAARDPQVAVQLFKALMTRMDGAGASGRAAALARLDAAYLVGALDELSRLSQSPEFAPRAPALRAIVQNTDAYTLAAKALSLQPGDPAMEFATALIASDRHREAYAQHAEKARAGAAQDALLARNIEKVQ